MGKFRTCSGNEEWFNYLEQRKVMGNKVGKMDHSCQVLKEYKD